MLLLNSSARRVAAARGGRRRASTSTRQLATAAGRPWRAEQSAPHLKRPVTTVAHLHVGQNVNAEGGTTAGVVRSGAGGGAGTSKNDNMNNNINRSALRLRIVRDFQSEGAARRFFSSSGGGTPATPSSSSTGPPPALTNHGAHGTKSAPPGGAHLQGTNPLTDKTKPPPFPLFDFSVPFSVRAKQAAKGTLFVASSVLAGSLLGYFLSNSEAKKNQIVSDVRSGQLFREVLGVQGGGDLREDDRDDVDDLPFSHVETDEEVSRLLALTLISDETFDKSDNLFVIVAESDRQFQDPIFKRQVRRLQQYVQRHCTAKGQREMEEEKERREKLREAGSNANLPNPSDTKADGETPTHTPTTNAAGLFGTGIGTAIVPSPEYQESTLEKMPHQALKNKIAASLPEDISFHYTIQENLGDVPDAHKTVKFMTYRGHRKANFEWDFSTGGVKEVAGAADVAPGVESGPENKTGSDLSSSASSNRSTSLRELIHSKIKPFYEFVSQDDFLIVEKGIQTISARQFEQFVLEDSHDYPVVLQMYEESCFLCFLMRPMMESLARMKEFSFLDPVRFLRINVEANDFPKGLPMARGTPQFLLYREGKGDKWEEFKPNDFMTKLISELKITDADQQDALRGLADAVQKRFQLFTAVAMWQLELRKLEEELSSGGEHESTREWVGRVALKDPKDDDFPQLISALMAADMKRTDTLVENIKFLEKEAEELEKDVSLLGVMLGRAVEEKESSGEGKGQREGEESGHDQSSSPSAASAPAKPKTKAEAGAAAPDFQPGKQEPPQATQPPPDAGAECDENVFVHTGECALSTKQSKQPQSATSSAGKSNENIKADVFKRSASSANTGGA